MDNVRCLVREPNHTVLTRTAEMSDPETFIKHQHGRMYLKLTENKTIFPTEGQVWTVTVGLGRECSAENASAGGDGIWTATSDLPGKRYDRRMPGALKWSYGGGLF